MKNNNDNLKEKEIKTEAPLKQDKLENVSGGSSGLRFGWYMPDYCFEYNSGIPGKQKCDFKYPCKSACCHSAIVLAQLGKGVTGAPVIDHKICTDCWHCDACAACPVSGEWAHWPVW
jgi:hypothetical protein